MPPDNNPPTPVLESVDVAIHADADCAALKAKYNVLTGKHGSNKKGGADQSHHILQNAAMKNASGERIITTYSGHAVMVNGGSRAPGSEHDIANKWQAVRARDANKAANPRPTFGQIKQWAKHDLAAAFQHGKPSRGMTDKEAEMLADCITAEAVEELQKDRTRNGKPRLNDNNRVTNPRGCFALGTLLWTTRGLLPVESLVLGDTLLSPDGPLPITRIDRCFNDVVELSLTGERLVVSANHRVRLASGRLLPAAQLCAGDVLADRSSAGVVVRAVHAAAHCEWIIGLGVSSHSATFIGYHGVHVELVDSGPPIRGHVHLHELSTFSSAALWEHRA